MTRTEEKRLRAFAATLRGSGLDIIARELEEMLPRRTRRVASPPRSPGKSKEERRQEKREARQATRAVAKARGLMSEVRAYRRLAASSPQDNEPHKENEP